MSFDGERIEPCKYEDTDSYKITKMFVNNRNQILKQLFKED
ncbi:MAG: ABC transporter ATP-binding protein, partial [Ruminococcaceae bacterium]|nr:ABC transporter ATP-binding protein [Oscillospiraceae bacterium]